MCLPARRTCSSNSLLLSCVCLAWQQTYGFGRPSPYNLPTKNHLPSSVDENMNMVGISLTLLCCPLPLTSILFLYQCRHAVATTYLPVPACLLCLPLPGSLSTCHNNRWRARAGAAARAPYRAREAERAGGQGGGAGNTAALRLLPAAGLWLARMRARAAAARKTRRFACCFACSLLPLLLLPFALPRAPLPRCPTARTLLSITWALYISLSFSSNSEYGFLCIAVFL